MLHLTRIILGSWLVAHKITLTATNHQGASLNPYLPPSRKRPQTSACTNFPLDTRLEVFSWTKSCFSHSHLVKQLVKQLHTLLTATELWSRTVSAFEAIMVTAFWSMDHVIVRLRGLLRQTYWTNMSHLFPTTWDPSYFPAILLVVS